MTSGEWSSIEAPELEGTARRALDRLLARIQELEPTLQGPPPPMHPDSALAGDDAAMAPYGVSHQARAPLIVSLDHLVLHGAALRGLPRIQPTASYTLLRPAIEGAAWAIWILAPEARDERVLRALKYMFLDQSDAQRVIRAGDGTPEHTLSGLRAELGEVAARRPGIANATLDGAPSAASVVKAAGLDIPGVGTLGIQFWTALSGLAHGRPHGMVMLTQREQLSGGADGAIELRVSPSWAIIASATAVALAYVETALNLCASRSAAPAGAGGR